MSENESAAVTYGSYLQVSELIKPFYESILVDRIRTASAELAPFLVGTPGPTAVAPAASNAGASDASASIVVSGRRYSSFSSATAPVSEAMRRGFEIWANPSSPHADGRAALLGPEAAVGLPGEPDVLRAAVGLDGGPVGRGVLRAHAGSSSAVTGVSRRRVLPDVAHQYHLVDASACHTDLLRSFFLNELLVSGWPQV